MTREGEGWVVLLRSRSAKRGDRWLPYGDVNITERVEEVEKNGKTILRRKSQQPQREATVHRKRFMALAIAADMEAAGAQVVVLPVQATGEKLKGAPVDELMIKASGAWESKAT